MVDWARFTPSEFEYDDDADHLAGHGVTLEEAAECFYNEHVVRKNRRHRPNRWQLLGRTDAGAASQDHLRDEAKEGRTDHHWLAVMTKRKRKLTDAEIDELVVREADDDTAWGPPIHVPAKPWAQRVPVRRLDLAAKFYVLSVLYRLGADATVSVGSQKDVDITIVRKPGEVLTVDVKVALDSKSWRIDDFSVDGSHFIVFVYFPGKSSASQAVPKSYVLNSRALRSWAKEHDGLVEAKELVKTAKDAREAWDRLLPAA